MFEFITNREDRGQVGIGTLIVFIAMVLVAAIAAGVLINTAGFLQTQAEATGEESTDLVSERIDVMSEVGIVGNPSPGELSEIRLGVSGAPGADQIDLTETTIQAVGPGGQENLVFTDTASGGAEVTQVTVPSLDDSESDAETISVDYNNIDGFSAGGDDLKLVVGIDTDDDGTANVEKSRENSDLSTTSVSFSDGSGGDIAFSSTSLSQGDDVIVDVVDPNNGDSSVLKETVTQTVDGIAFSTTTVSDGDSSVTVNFNYDNIESIDDSDDTQELLVTFDPGGAGTTTTVTAADISDGSVTINADDGDGGSTAIDTSSSTANQFSSADSIDFELSDSSSSLGTATLSVGSSTELISTTAAKATGIISNTVAELGPNEFAVGSDGNFRSSAVLNEQDDFTILINPDAGALKDTNANEAFGESDSATLDIVSPAGATTSVELRAPDLFNTNGEAVRL
jgi:flagellin-like protein